MSKSKEALERLKVLFDTRNKEVVNAIGKDLAKWVLVDKDGSLKLKRSWDMNLVVWEAYVENELKKSGLDLGKQWTPEPKVRIDENMEWRAWNRRVEPTPEEWDEAGRKLK